MKEAYVSFGTAKLLKEKGFDWECYGTYNIIEEVFMNEHSVTVVSHTNKNSTLGNAWISAPTQQMACRWLREEHNIHIMPTIDSDAYRTQKIFYGAMIASFNNNGDISYHGPLYENGYNEPEDAVEFALEYALKNLI